jgi:osmotically-inducible protein OsmY
MSIVPPTIQHDAAVQRDVLDELRRDPHVTVSDIGVSVKEGVVTLTGHVEHYLTRMAAQNAALRVAGVHAVANDIEVRLHADPERTDSDLALATLSALTWDAAIQTDTLDVTVAHGYVTLKGTV